MSKKFRIKVHPSHYRKHFIPLFFVYLLSEVSHSSIHLKIFLSFIVPHSLILAFLNLFVSFKIRGELVPQKIWAWGDLNPRPTGFFHLESKLLALS